ncbi:hypothetical protein [Pseudaeromonas paramecii]
MNKLMLCLLCASLSLSAYGEDEKTQVLLKSEKISGVMKVCVYSGGAVETKKIKEKCKPTIKK